MSGVSTAAYFARRAAQKERVRILYRRALKDTLNWAVHRHIFYRDFNANQDVEDVDRIDKLIAHGEAEYDKWQHPDPYIRAMGSWWLKVLQKPAGIEIVYNYGQEDNPKPSLHIFIPINKIEADKLKIFKVETSSGQL